MTPQQLIDALVKEKPRIERIANKFTTDEQKEQFCKELYWQMTQSKAADSKTFSDELKSMFNQYFKK